MFSTSGAQNPAARRSVSNSQTKQHHHNLTPGSPVAVGINQVVVVGEDVLHDVAQNALGSGLLLRCGGKEVECKGMHHHVTRHLRAQCHSHRGNLEHTKGLGPVAYQPCNYCSSAHLIAGGVALPLPARVDGGVEPLSSRQGLADRKNRAGHQSRHASHVVEELQRLPMAPGKLLVLSCSSDCVLENLRNKCVGKAR